MRQHNPAVIDIAPCKSMFHTPIRFFLLIFSVIGLVGVSAAMAVDKPNKDSNASVMTSTWSPDSTIKVGVRRDASPFSYATSSTTKERFLAGYGGYMIEICRRVLEEVISSGVMGKDIKVIPREVRADERFDDLDNRNVDLLCGPDSITLNRLKKYSVSHPVYLSGTTYISLPVEKFPRFKYCEGVIGVLDGTTAEEPGLARIAKSGELQRFDEALDSYLEQLAKPPAPALLLDNLTSLANDIEWLVGGKRIHDRASGESKVVPSRVKTGECPEGYKVGPVVVYDSHEEGLSDFCAGKIFFYVGDVDIITRNATCDYITRRETLASESYGFYFRNFDKKNGTTDTKRSGGSDHTNCFSEHESKKVCRQYFQDLLLYSEFNNALLRKMQSKEDILLFEFKTEFEEESPTQDLKNFFDIFKYASGH